MHVPPSFWSSVSWPQCHWSFHVLIIPVQTSQRQLKALQWMAATSSPETKSKPERNIYCVWGRFCWCDCCESYSRPVISITEALVFSSAAVHRGWLMAKFLLTEVKMKNHPVQLYWCCWLQATWAIEFYNIWRKYELCLPMQNLLPQC